MALSESVLHSTEETSDPFGHRVSGTLKPMTTDMLYKWRRHLPQHEAWHNTADYPSSKSLTCLIFAAAIILQKAEYFSKALSESLDMPEHVPYKMEPCGLHVPCTEKSLFADLPYILFQILFLQKINILSKILVSEMEDSVSSVKRAYFYRLHKYYSPQNVSL